MNFVFGYVKRIISVYWADLIGQLYSNGAKLKGEYGFEIKNDSTSQRVLAQPTPRYMRFVPTGADMQPCQVFAYPCQAKRGLTANHFDFLSPVGSGESPKLWKRLAQLIYVGSAALDPAATHNLSGPI